MIIEVGKIKLKTQIFCTLRMGSWILVDINSSSLPQRAASQHYYFHIFAYVYKSMSIKICRENKEDNKINHSEFHLCSICNSFLIAFVLVLVILDFKVGFVFYLKIMSSIPIICSSQVFRCISKNPQLQTMFPNSKMQ